MRSAKGLEADQLIKIHTVTLPRTSTSGNVERQLFLDISVSIDDPIVQNFIELLHDRNVFGVYKMEKPEFVVADGIEVADEGEIQRIAGNDLPEDDWASSSKPLDSHVDPVVASTENVDMAGFNEMMITASVTADSFREELTLQADPFARDPDSGSLLDMDPFLSGQAQMDAFAAGPFGGFTEASEESQLGNICV